MLIWGMKHPGFLCLEVGESRGINKVYVSDQQFPVFLFTGPRGRTYTYRDSVMW